MSRVCSLNPNRNLVVAVFATLVLASAAMARWPEDFAPPPWRGLPLTVQAEWECMTPFSFEGQDVAIEYVDCVGTAFMR